MVDVTGERDGPVPHLPAGIAERSYVPCASPYTTTMPSPWPSFSQNWTLEVLVTDPAGNIAFGYWQFNTYIIT